MKSLSNIWVYIIIDYHIPENKRGDGWLKLIPVNFKKQMIL